MAAPKSNLNVEGTRAYRRRREAKEYRRRHPTAASRLFPGFFAKPFDIDRAREIADIEADAAIEERRRRRTARDAAEALAKPRRGGD